MPYKDKNHQRDYMRELMRQRRAEGKVKKPSKLQVPNNKDLQAIGEFTKPPIELEVETGQPLWLVISLVGAVVFFVVALIIKYL